jgi:pyruvate kinase
MQNYIRKTKIVCTMGPACDTDDVVRSVIVSGMNVARFNFSHGSHQEHKTRMDRVRRISASLAMPVALMLDTKGPEIRTGPAAEGCPVAFATGDKVLVTTDAAPTTPPAGSAPGRLSITWQDALARVTPGVRIRIADGLLELEVEKNDGAALHCRATNSATIGARKNVNLVGIHAGLPILAEQDKLDLIFGTAQDVDFIAASFLSFPREVTEIRAFLRKQKSSAKIIAKIENEEGLKNIEEIAALADGIMVARGDLAVQIPDERIPLEQKKIITVARRHCKPVIIATQMLDSMIVNPRPTRAELTDAANAVFDGADALMLSGETAQGAYPSEAAATLVKIAVTVEQSDEYHERSRAYLAAILNAREKPAREHAQHTTEIAEAIARGACETARTVHAKVILTPTLSGNTARQISRYRPDQPIVAVTPNPHTSRSLLLNWGVVPRQSPQAGHSDEMIQNALKICFDSGMAAISERLVLAAGLPLGSPQPLNTLRVLIMGNVLARSISGGYANPAIHRANGRIVWADTASEARSIIKAGGGEILVCPALTEDYIPIIRITRGVICEGVCTLEASLLTTINPNLVWLAGVQNAERKLETGLAATIDGKSLLVYEGTI